MIAESTQHFISSWVSITISIIVSYLFWQRRKAAGAKTMSIIMILTAEWAIANLLSSLNIPMSEKIFWGNLKFIGIIIIPVAWLIFSVQYTQSEKFLTFKNFILISIMPALTTIIILTNNYHHLFEINIGTAKLGTLTTIAPNFGVWFWVHTTYSYGLILIGAIIIIKKLLRQSQIYRNQAIFMLLGTLAPFIGNIFYTFNLFPLHGVDLTVISFPITGLFFFWGMFRYKLFDLIPAAREAVIESMDELIIVLDTQNRIIDINSSAQKIFDKKAIDLIGKPIFSILDDKLSSFMNYEDIMELNEKIVLSVSNSKRFYNFRISPLYDSKGKINGRFIIMQDITVLEETIKNLQESRKSAEDSNKAKSQFLATMSHEIRTPLNGIIGMAEILTSANLTDEEKSYLQSIQGSADSLLDIINDILDFSKIEAGKMELEKTYFNLKSLIDTINKTFSFEKNGKNIKLISSLDANIPEALIGDPKRLRQVLVNLIGNAFKFTEKGSIKINVVTEKVENNQVYIKFTVSDTGIGIPEDKINKLFNSFEQLDSSTSRKYGGTGLGLTIVKNLIAMMGGNIDVESQQKKGSSFFFTLPFEVVTSTAPQYSAYISEINFLNNNLKILLAEDNKVNQLFMIKLLEMKKIKVDLAGNGIEALQKWERNSYNFILMDIQMPEMDGYEATLAIREREKNTGKHIIIIALTANATEEDRIKCIQVGMDDYLSKPVKSERLYTCLKKYI